MPTLPALKSQFSAAPQGTKQYLRKLEGLLTADTLDIALAYTFMKLEEGNHRALKCGVFKGFKCKSSKIDDALAKQHFTRDYYRKVFKNVIGKHTPKEASDKLTSAEKVRDRQIHGKVVSSRDLRQGISDALAYIVMLAVFLEEETGRNPFGDLRGLVGRAEQLDDVKSYWILKGLGFYTDEKGAGS